MAQDAEGVEACEIPLGSLREGQAFRTDYEMSQSVKGLVLWQASGMTTVVVELPLTARLIVTGAGDEHEIPGGVRRVLTTWAPSCPVVKLDGVVDPKELYEQVRRKAGQPGEEGSEMAKRKKEKKVRVKASGVAAHYEVTDKDAAELGPQAAIVYAGVKAVGPADAAHVAQNCRSRLKTKQEPIRVVSYYLSQLKASGHLKVAPPASADQAV